MSETDFYFDSSNPHRRKPFSQLFSQLLPRTSQLDIYVGYMGEPSLQFLHEITLSYPELHLNIVAGMPGSEGISHSQLKQARELDSVLVESGRGGVFVTPRVPYHGKVYIFDIQTDVDGQMDRKAYIGSNNLNSILQKYERTFEVGVLFHKAPEEILEHLARDIWVARESISKTSIPILVQDTSPLETYNEYARAISVTEIFKILQSKHTHEFNIPLKTTSKSNLNVFNGKGRTSNINVQKRRWYEVELIVNKAITTQPGYPRGETFTVLTDDGWTFDCTTNGSNYKNLRSSGDLGTLGAWIKGRLMESGVLSQGDLITDQTLRDYGRYDLTMRYHPDEEIWTFDLSV